MSGPHYGPEDSDGRPLAADVEIKSDITRQMRHAPSYIDRWETGHRYRSLERGHKGDKRDTGESRRKPDIEPAANGTHLLLS
jgi:hypothetical protein